MRPGPIAASMVAALFFASASASAHAFLQTAAPGVGSTIRTAPTQVVIAFTEDLEPAFSTIVVQDPAGGREDAGAIHLQGDARHLAIALKPLRPGTYKVIWHATSVDTHRTQGSFSFTVAG